MFQTQVNINQALGVPGDLASANTTFSEVGGPGAFVAGAGGVYVGRFCWIVGNEVFSTGVGVPDGFIGRSQQALISEFTGQYSMLIPEGFPVTVINHGEFLALNSGTAASTRGASVYADSATGLCSVGSAASVMAAAFTGAIAKNIVANTGSIAANTCTAAIADTTMTVSAVGSGSALFPGQTLTGTDVATGTTIVEQLTGTTGSTGTYEVSISQTVASTTVTASGGTLTVVAMTSGTIVVGQTLSGTGVTAGNTVLGRISGTGGAGTYHVSVGDAVSSQAITASGGTLTVSAVASGTILPNEVFAGANVTSGSLIVSNITGTGGTGTYFTSVSETVSSESMTIAGSVDTGWKWGSVVSASEIGKISSWTR